MFFRHLCAAVLTGVSALAAPVVKVGDFRWVTSGNAGDLYGYFTVRTATGNPFEIPPDDVLDAIRLNNLRLIVDLYRPETESAPASFHVRAFNLYSSWLVARSVSPGEEAGSDDLSAAGRAALYQPGTLFSRRFYPMEPELGNIIRARLEYSAAGPASRWRLGDWSLFDPQTETQTLIMWDWRHLEVTPFSYSPDGGFLFHMPVRGAELTSATAAIPEPSTGAFALAGLALLIAGRRFARRADG
jgi:hypothetical protein